MQSIKAVVVGNGGSGKTCLLLRYTSNVFPGEYIPTVFDNYSANVLCDGRAINLGLWDTAGAEDYWRLRPLSYPQTDVFILCFSICRRQHFTSVLESWHNEISEFESKAPIILVGCKSDIRQSKKYLEGDYYARYHPEMDFISVSEAHEMARKIGAFAYIECSAYTGKNVANVFQTALRAALGAPKQVTKSSSSGLFSALKKKMKLNTNSNKIKNSNKETHNEKLVISTTYTFTENNRFGHAAVYYNKNMYVFGGYKNMQNELIETPAYWDGQSASKWKYIHQLSGRFQPRAYPCAVVVHPSLANSNNNNNNNNNNYNNEYNEPDYAYYETHYLENYAEPNAPPPPVQLQAQILIFGGKSNGYLNDTICFDPVALTIEVMETTGRIPSPRYGMSAVSHRGEMYIFGGYDKDSEPCNDCYKFNYQLREWTKLDLNGAVPSPRFFHSATMAADGLMIIYGGKHGVNVLADLFSINLDTGECKELTQTTNESPGPRQNHTCTYVGRGNIVLAGGITKNKVVSNDIYLCSIDTRKWTRATVKGAMPHLQSHTAVYVHADAELWLGGGKDEKDELRLATKVRVALNTPRIFDVLPLSSLRDIFHYFTAEELPEISVVCRKFYAVANDDALWQEFALMADPKYHPKTHGNPKRYYRSTMHVWYNDFSQPPEPAKTNYIRYGAPNFQNY